LSLLVQNGIDHTPKGEEIAIKAESNRVITVTTNGAVIQDEIAKNLFNPFVTTTANNLGIGLTLALLYTKQFDGIIFLSENDLGKGVQFCICFPD